MKQIDWIDRKFNFPEQNIMPEIIERLAGTSLRIRARLEKIPPAHYTRKPDEKWSILEHVGHLSDLETLWQLRLEEILSNKEELKPADMDNRQTWEANHNSKSADELINEFERLRGMTLERINSLRDEDAVRSAYHPRLKFAMRIVDLFFFAAEHDDHHLARITAIEQLLKSS